MMYFLVGCLVERVFVPRIIYGVVSLLITSVASNIGRIFSVLLLYFLMMVLPLVVMVVLRLGKSQVTIVGILPNICSQLACYCLVWGIRLVYGPTTVGQVTVKTYFTSCSTVHRLIVFFSFMFRFDMQVPN